MTVAALPRPGSRWIIRLALLSVLSALLATSLGGRAALAASRSVPEPPSLVTSADYPADGSFHGGAGVAGRFTFFPPATGAVHISGYAYTLDTGTTWNNAAQVAADPGDHRATVTVTPPFGGSATLRVWSRDNQGHYSTSAYSYVFGVMSPAGPDARWRLDEGGGTAAADATGHGNALTVTGAVWAAGRYGAGTALAFDGAGDSAQTGGPIATGGSTTVRTDANFTVTAWAKLDSRTGPAAVVSQDGTRVSAWALGYDPAIDRWRFAMAGSDANAPAIAAVSSDAAPVTGQWTYLVATYDVATHHLRLLVDGVAQTGTATLTGGFNAGGPVVLGRGRWAGNAGGYFNGAVDDVRIYGRLVDASEPELTGPLMPQAPSLTFPDGNVGHVGQPLRVTLSGNGDPSVTTIRYVLSSAGPESTATLTPPGGQVTVTVTPIVAGTLWLSAQAVTGAGWRSDIATAIIQVTASPSLRGTVLNALNGDALAGVTVTLQPGGATSITNAFGEYSFTGLTAGTYTVEVPAPGDCLEPASVELEITGQTVESIWIYPLPDCPAP